MMKRSVVFAAVLACLISLGARAGDILNIGDAAPPLKVSKWVKGAKVETFEPGRTYVVEFWATWCGPCRATIPHLTELAHKYKDKNVAFLGIDVWEDDTNLVEPFLKEMGDKMDYSVALDQTPEGGDRMSGAMAKGWMAAAGENGIPTAFVINDGKIAWIGHPMELDKPLEQVVAGEYKPGDMAAKRLVALTKQRKMMIVQQQVYTPFQAHDWKATLAAINDAAASEPELAEQFTPIKFAALCNGGDVELGLELGNKLYEANKDEGDALNNIFWYVIDPKMNPKPDPRVAQLALKAATRSNELTHGESFANLDTLAEAQFATGDSAAALATEEKALKRLEMEVDNHDHPYFKQFQASLDRFRKAAATRKTEAP